MRPYLKAIHPSLAFVLLLTSVCLNAGAALYAADVTDTIAGGIELARTTIASGAAHAKMQAFVTATQRLAARG